MTIEILKKDGHARIKAHMNFIDAERDRWKLFVIDYAYCAVDIPTMTIIRNIAAGLSQMEGMIAITPSQMILCLIKTTVPAPDFLEKIKAFIPRGFDFTAIDHSAPPDQIEKISMTVETVENIKSLNLAAPHSTHYTARLQRNQNRILVIDDDHYTRALLVSIFKPRYEVFEAEDKDDIIKIYNDFLPDAVLLDIHMPQRSGFDILGDILSEDPDAFVLLLSADAIEANVIKAAQKGAKGFMGKPVRRETLDSHIRQCPTLKAPPSILMKA